MTDFSSHGTGAIFPAEEIAPTRQEKRAVAEGRKQFARSEYEEWKERRKRVVS